MGYRVWCMGYGVYLRYTRTVNCIVLDVIYVSNACNVTTTASASWSVARATINRRPLGGAGSVA